MSTKHNALQGATDRTGKCRGGTSDEGDGEMMLEMVVVDVMAWL